MTIPDGRPALEIEAFKALMSTFPTGVSIVTTIDAGGEPHGLTCSAVCSLSLEPPMLLVCIGNDSRTLARICEGGRFAVSLLHEGGREAAQVFSSDVPNRFGRVEWRPTPCLSLPCLVGDAHAVAECRVSATMVLGDHTVVGAEVVGVTRLVSTRPLLYGMRTYAAWPGRWERST
jgi:flavin reductase (DIM6/NTAB) family NADH-FMN oxidoreductase RutF